MESITGAILRKLLVERREKIWDLSCSRSVVLLFLHFSESLWSEASPTELLHSSASGCTRVCYVKHVEALVWSLYTAAKGAYVCFARYRVLHMQVTSKMQIKTQI